MVNLRAARRLVRTGLAAFAFRFLVVLAPFVVLVAVWEAWFRTHESLFVPPMSDIFERFRDDWLSGPWTKLFLSERFFDDVGPSVGRALGGWALAGVLGIAIGVLMGRWRDGAAFLTPLIRFGMALPSVALLPVFMVLFGLGDDMKRYLIAFGAIWPILLNTLDGVRSIDPTVLRTSRVLRLSRRTFVAKVLLPASAPQIFAGLRISLGISLILMVVSEMFASSDGIGFGIITAQRTFRTLDMWSGILLLGLLGVALNRVLLYVERHVLRWHRGARKVEI